MCALQVFAASLLIKVHWGHRKEKIIAQLNTVTQ